jgi:hypothetical protein
MMNKGILSFFVILLLTLIGYGIWEIAQDGEEIRASVSVAEAMGGGSSEGYL